MIKAASLSAEGVPQENNIREFSEKHWADMNYQFGDKLRWVRIKEEKKKSHKLEKRRKQMKKEYADKAEKVVSEIIGGGMTTTEDLTEENTNIE